MATSTQNPNPTGTAESKRIKVVVATSVMLSFISFWRAAAIVLNDLGSSAFYAGGIAEQAVGPAAPWFILGVMLFSYAVRAVYVESCAMFTRGGVYRVVKEAMGGTLAKVSVSALMFDYILTGPISGVSAGQYIVGLVAQTLTYFGHPWAPDKDTINHIAAGIAVAITIYFWWRNTKGIHESSDDALKIMYIVTAMMVVMIGWSAITLISNPETRRLPPKPAAYNLVYNKDAIGWMPKLIPGMFVDAPKTQPVQAAAGATGEASVSAAPEESRFVIPKSAGMLLGLIGILIAFGHSFLAMSGEESLAQVNRELEYPKHENLMKAGMVIFLYSLAFTSLVSFFAYALIPDAVRPQYYDNLISGIAMYLVGPTPLKLIFQGFIVLVGFLMLAGAVNTAIIGSNGVLNRVSEDGVLTDWFRAPHKKYGTTHRMIDMIVILQLLTIIGSRGEVYTLGEAYAFGVIWSFAFKGLAMVVLRFKDRSHREWQVPFNIHMGDLEVPIGISVIALILFSIAGINLITKQVATVSGVAFTLVFYALFWASEHYNHRKRGTQPHVEMDQFKIIAKDEISHDDRYIRPGNVLCLVRDYNTLDHVKYAIDQVDTEKKDLVVMTIRKLTGPDTGYENLDQSELFTSYEQLLFSKVVTLAEKAGKHVELMVVPSSQVFQAIVMSAVQLKSSEVIAGRSSVMEPSVQALQLGQAWEQLPSRPEHPITFKVIDAAGKAAVYYLGAHSPELSVAEIDTIHKLWLEVTKLPGNENVHHGDIVGLALARLKDDLRGPNRDEILKKITAPSRD
jgi:amino acid transporter